MYGLESEEPGVEIVRREFLVMSVGALGALLMGARRRQDAISWDEFIKDLVPKAESVVAKKMEEEAYVASVMETLKRVDRSLIPKDLPKQKTFSIVEYRISKDKGFKWHDHRNYNGVIYVLEGSVRCRSFDIVGEEKAPPKGQKVQIRETASALVEVGATSTLTTKRDNIHDVRGGENGGRMLDIFTWMGPNARSHYLDVNETPVDKDKKIYEGSFKS
jgi:quercetin dioxygenase-like cupin family protein